jgi:hypothetical protein
MHHVLPAGITSYLEPLFQPSLQLTSPLAMQLLPHQTLLQPSAAAANLPLLLSSLGEQQTALAAASAGARAGSSSTAAVLCNGCYCCATSSWQSMGSLQLLALQIIATTAAAGCAEQHQQASGLVLQERLQHMLHSCSSSMPCLQWFGTSPCECNKYLKHLSQP